MHERRAELRDPLARLVDAVRRASTLRTVPSRSRVQEPEPRRDVHRRGVRRLRVVVDEHEERDLLVADECSGVALVAGADRDELDALRL